MATKRRGADLTDVRVARLVEKWRARLLTSEWVIGVRVLDDLKAVAHEDGDDELVDAYAYTQVEEAYFSARMTFNASRLRGRGEAFLDLVACHEVLHCVLATQEGLVRRALRGDERTANTVCENAVERLSRALVRLQRPGQRGVK
jgi:hypothetical protein